MAGALDQLGIGNYFNIPLGGASLALVTFIITTVFILVFLVYIVWYIKVGKYTIIIRENRGDDVLGRGYKYTGRKVTQNKTPRIKAIKFLRFAPIRDFLPMPELNQMIHAGFKDLIVYEKRGNDYYPTDYFSKQIIKCPNCNVELEREYPYLHPMDYKVRQWFVLNWKENAMRFKTRSLFEQYAPFALFVLGMAILMIMWYMLLNKSEVLSSSLTANAQATVELAKAISTFNSA